MSILDVWVSDDRALIGVDTEGVERDGTRNSVAKMHLMPHAEMVIAGRGMPLFARAVSEFCNVRSYRFDEAVSNLDELLQTADSKLAELAASVGIDAGWPALRNQQVVFVGWSDHAKAYRANWLTRSDGAAAFSETAVEPSLCAPGMDSWGPPPTENIDSIDGIFRMVEWQYERGKDVFRDAGFGGSILVAEMTRGNLTVRSRRL